MLESSTVALQDKAAESVTSCSTHLSSIVSPPMQALVSELSAVLDAAGDEEQALGVVPNVLSKYLVSEDLLTGEQRSNHGDSYTRHLIHADPQGRFSLLSIVWMPGQASPVHGHNAWGVVGVHAGQVENTCFNVQAAAANQSAFTYTARESQRAWAGCVVSTGAGDEGAHRLANPCDEPACTIHIYGMDLALEPTGINRYYD